jgi:hypothetical protein
MASIVLSVVGCIDYLAYGAIFTRVMFLPKKKVMFFWIFFPARKAQDVRREEVEVTSAAFLAGKKHHIFFGRNIARVKILP